MKYTTYFLKFASKEQGQSKLDEVGYKVISTLPNNEEVTQYRVTDQVGDIDIIGDLYNNDAIIETDEDGTSTIISPPTKLDGWHVNIILEDELPPALEEYVVTPKNPHRIFA